MVYVVTDSETGGRTMLVRVKDNDELDSRLRLSGTQKIEGCFTDNEILVMSRGTFAVISA